MKPPAGARRATTDEIGRVLSAAPAQPWHVGELPARALRYTLHRTVDADWIAAHAERAVGRAGQAAPHGRKRSTVWVVEAPPYRRTEWSSDGGAKPDSALLEHPGLGVVYLDLDGGSHLHLGPEQIPRTEMPGHEQQVAAAWRMQPGERADEQDRPSTRATVVEAGQPSRARWVLRSIDAPELNGYATAVLRSLVGHAEQLEGSAFPFEELAGHGFPTHASTFGTARRRETSVGEATVLDPVVVPTDPALFSPPTGSTDLRNADPTKPSRRATHRIVVPRATRRSRMRPNRVAAARRAVAAPGFAEHVVTPDGAVLARAEPEIELPECLASTQRVGSAMELRQFLLDHAGFVVGSILGRFSDLGGRRQETDDQDVTIDFDWLGAMRDGNQASLDAGGAGDALFCLLRDAPPAGSPTLGATGLLDQAAAGAAARLLAGDDPLGADELHPPLDLDDEGLVAEIQAVLADPAIEPEDRFTALTALARARLREAVLEQRLGRFRVAFPGASPLLRLPSPNSDLLHVTFRLDEFRLRFAPGGTTVEELVIRGDAPGQEIAVGLRFAGITATFSHTREPGEHFWIVAAGLLVAAGVILPPAIATVVALGPLGLPGLLAVTSLLGSAAVPAAAVLLAVSAFVLWDSATLTASIDEFHVRMSVQREFADDDHDLVVLATDDADVDGTISITYESQVPSGVHQVLGWFTAGLVNLFDLARDALVERIEQEVSAALRERDQLVLPTPVTLARAGRQVIGHTVVGGAFGGTDRNRYAAQVLSDLTVRPRDAGLFITQVDPNALPALQAAVDAFGTVSKGPAYGGYGLSQNLLNAYGYATWVARSFEAELDDDQMRAVFTALGPLAARCAEGPDREVHVWAAAPPRVLLTPQAFWSDSRRPCLTAVFDDLRLCVGCGTGKDSSVIELRFGVRVRAHVGLGRPSTGGELSFLAAGPGLANVYYDDGEPDSIVVEPLDTQSMDARGEAFAPAAGLDGAQRAAVLGRFQEVFRSATAAVLGRMSASVVPFEDAPARFDRQIYDGWLFARLTPVRTGLYVTLGLIDDLFPLLPRPDGQPPLQDVFNGLGCEAGRHLLEVINERRQRGSG